MDKFLVILYAINADEFHLAERDRYFDGVSPVFFFKGVVSEEAAKTLIAYGYAQDYTEGHL